MTRKPGSADLSTNSNQVASPAPTLEEMLEAIDQALAAPRLIGSIMGMPVYVDGRLGDRTIEIRGATTLRFRADHPLIAGTKLAEAARRR